MCFTNIIYVCNLDFLYNIAFFSNRNIGNLSAFVNSIVLLELFSKNPVYVPVIVAKYVTVPAKTGHVGRNFHDCYLFLINYGIAVFHPC